MKHCCKHIIPAGNGKIWFVFRAPDTNINAGTWSLPSTPGDKVHPTEFRKRFALESFLREWGLIASVENDKPQEINHVQFFNGAQANFLVRSNRIAGAAALPTSYIRSLPKENISPALLSILDAAENDPALKEALGL